MPDTKIIRNTFYIFCATPETSFDITIEIGKLLVDPIREKLNAYSYEFLMDNEVSSEYEKFTNKEVFYELIYRLFNEDYFYLNGTYKNYGAESAFVADDKSYISFTKEEHEYRVYKDAERFKLDYPKRNQYLVYWDPDNTIIEPEMYTLFLWVIEKVGKDNPYTNVVKYLYVDETKEQSFFILYYGPEPNLEEQRNAIRNHLIETLGYDEAKRQFPALFIDSNRKIYLMLENKAYPVNFRIATSFIEQYMIAEPEIILVLDWYCPLVVEYGVSDIIPNYCPIEEDGNIDSNQFLYFLTTVLNYLDKRIILTNEFKNLSQFYENEERASFVCNNIRWDVMKDNI